MGNERRRHFRVKVQRVSGHLKAAGEMDLGLPIENISAGGLLMGVARPLAVGTRVDLELTRPGGGGALRLQGRVVSSRAVPSMTKGVAATIGVRFEEVTPQNRERLEQLLKELSALGAEPIPHPAMLDPERVEAARQVFDFGFRSLSEDTAPPGGPSTGPTLQVPHDARLMGQVKGLMLELEEAQQLLVERDRTIATLRQELEDLRGELERRARWNDELEAMVRELQKG